MGYVVLISCRMTEQRGGFGWSLMPSLSQEGRCHAVIVYGKIRSADKSSLGRFGARGILGATEPRLRPELE